MLVDFQLSTSRLLALLRNRLRQYNLCIDETFDYGGSTCIVDRIIVDPGTTILTSPTTATITLAGDVTTTVTAQSVRIAQPVRLPIVALDDLKAADGAPATPIAEPVVTLFVRVWTDITDAGTPRTCIATDGVDLGPLEDLVPGLADTIDTTLDFTSCRAMPVGSLERLLDGDLDVVNIGLVVVDGSGLTIRLEVGDAPADAAAWTAFHAGTVDDLRAGRDWAMLIDKDLIVDSAVRRVSDGVGSSGQMIIASGPSGAWSAPNGVGHVAITFDGVVEDACWCAAGIIPIEVDVDVDVSIDIDFVVSTPNELRMEAEIDWTKDFWSTACCTLTAALMWPLVGAMMMADETVDFGEYLGGLVMGPAGVFIASIVAANDQAPDADALAGDCEKIDDHHLVCRETVNLPASPLYGTMTLDATAGVAAGLVLRGSLASVPETELPGLTVTNVQPFTWTMERPCTSSTQTATAVVTMTKSGTAPLHVCDATARNDAEHVFHPVLNRTGTQLDFEMHILVLPQAYRDAPYPCELLVRTNAGARWVTVPPVPPAPQVDLVELTHWRATHCMTFEHLLWGRLFNPQWHVDPPYELVAEHLWQIEIVGVAIDEVATMTDGAGTVIMSAPPAVNGVVRLGAIVTPGGAADGEVGLTVRRAGAEWTDLDLRRERWRSAVAELDEADRAVAADAAEGRGRRRLECSQSLLVNEATIALPDLALDVVAGRGERGQPMLAVPTGRRVLVYDVTSPASAMLVTVLPGHGARFEGRGVTTWGEHGITHAPWRGPIRAITTEPVTSVTWNGGRRLVATDDRIIVTDAHWSVRSESSTRQSRRSAHDARLHAAGWTLGIEPDELRAIAMRVCAAETADVEPIRVPGSRSAVLVRRASGGRSVFDTSDPRRPIEIARHAADPWFIRTARVGRTLGRLDDARERLIISTVARTVVSTLGAAAEPAHVAPPPRAPGQGERATVTTVRRRSRLVRRG